MPLLVFSVNTRYDLTSTVADEMETDGGFTLSHEFTIPPHEDSIFSLKHVYINVTGDGRGTGFKDRGENKEPSYLVDTIFPDLEEDIVTSKRNVTLIRDERTGQNTEQFPRVLKKDDPDQIRFPITCYPVNGWSTSGGTYNSNRHNRNDNNSVAAHYEARGMHTCDIPLGKMRIKDNRIGVRVIPRGVNLETFNSGTGQRRVRIRNISVILEYN